MIEAKIIADSKSAVSGDRITTYLLTFPRIILAELNTHRMFSRNSASSRAIPFEKMLKRVKENPFIPIKWMKDHSGMQGTEYFPHFSETNNPNTDTMYGFWMDARDEAIRYAECLSRDGLTKQICNRLLEPFMWHQAIVTATEFQNFFSLRAEGAAEIHLQSLAYKMLDAYNESIPKLLQPGEWHIPLAIRWMNKE